MKFHLSWFNFEYVHEIIILSGKLSYNLSISCHFKVEVTLKIKVTEALKGRL